MWCELHETSSHNTKDCKILQKLKREKQRKPKESYSPDKKFIQHNLNRTMNRLKPVIPVCNTYINGTEVKVLIDSGADSNYISPKTVKYLDLDVKILILYQ